MTGKFKPCMDILPPAQKRLWPVDSGVPLDDSGVKPDDASYTDLE